jgi:hypothetical protein
MSDSSFQMKNRGTTGAAQVQLGGRLATAERLSAKVDQQKCTADEKPLIAKLLKSAKTLLASLRTDFDDETYHGMADEIATWQNKVNADLTALEKLGKPSPRRTAILILLTNIELIKDAASEL